MDLIQLPGVPLGAFVGVSYDEVTFPLNPGDVFVFCSDGVSEAMNESGQEFTPARLKAVVDRTKQQSAAQIAQAVTSAVAEHRAGFPPNDDTSVVVVKIAD